MRTGIHPVRIHLRAYSDAGRRIMLRPPPVPLEDDRRGGMALVAYSCLALAMAGCGVIGFVLGFLARH